VALALDERIAQHKKSKYSRICANFETKYKMSSEIFLKKFDSGQLDDRDDFFDWYASCTVKIPIIGTFFYKNVFMQVIST